MVMVVVMMRSIRRREEDYAQCWTGGGRRARPQPRYGPFVRAVKPRVEIGTQQNLSISGCCWSDEQSRRLAFDEPHRITSDSERSGVLATRVRGIAGKKSEGIPKVPYHNSCSPIRPSRAPLPPLRCVHGGDAKPNNTQSCLVAAWHLSCVLGGGTSGTNPTGSGLEYCTTVLDAQLAWNCGCS
jgi:hypothetical protein